MTETLPNDLKFEDVQRQLLIQDDRAIIRRQQEIPPDFWDRLLETKQVQDSAPVGEFLQVATIPCLVIEEWFAQGFNIFDKNVTLQEIVARLKAEDKDRLITTSRQI